MNFPKDPKLRNEWLLKCCRADNFNTKTRNCTICSVHFKEEDFVTKMQPELLGTKCRRQLKEGCIPSQNLPKENQPSTSCGIRRRKRMLVNDEKKILNMTNKKSKRSNKTTKKKISYESAEVEKILNKKTLRGTIMYLLKWKDFPDSEASWEKKSNLNCPELIKEFEDTLKKANAKKIEKNVLKEKNTTRKRNISDCSMKKKLSSFKTLSSTSRKNTQTINDLPIKTAPTSKKNTQNINDRPVKAVHSAPSTRKNNRNINDLPTKADSGAMHARKMSAELNKCEAIKKRYDDFGTKHARNKTAELNKHEATKKRYDDFGAKHTEKKSVERNEREVTKKRYDDPHYRTGNKKKKLNNHENNKRKYVDHGSKQSENKYAELKERQISKRKSGDHGSKPSENKNAQLKECQITERRSDGLNQTPCKAAQRSIRSQTVPKIQHLHYYVRSKNFPRNRKDGACSIMGVSFIGSDVLKGFERLVEAGIAVAPLPDYLYAEPIRTGKTDFTITV